MFLCNHKQAASKMDAPSTFFDIKLRGHFRMRILFHFLKYRQIFRTKFLALMMARRRRAACGRGLFPAICRHRVAPHFVRVRQRIHRRDAAVHPQRVRERSAASLRERLLGKRHGGTAAYRAIDDGPGRPRHMRLAAHGRGSRPQQDCRRKLLSHCSLSTSVLALLSPLMLH